MAGLKQVVHGRITVNSPYHQDVVPIEINETLEGVTHKNIRSRVKEWIDTKLIQWSVMSGAKIEIEISPVADDEYSRPDPE